MLLMPQPELMQIPSTGHVIYDYAVGAAVLVLGILRTMEFIGVSPSKEVNAKTVGRLSIESLRSIVRHETANLITPITVRMSDYQSKNLSKLDEINLGIREMVTILRERKQ